MKLGDGVQIAIGVSNLEQSLSFYKTLGFEVIDHNSEPYPWTLLTDGQNRILLNMDGNIYVGLLYFAADAAKRVAALERMGITFLQKQEQDGQLFMAIFADENGFMVGLLNHDANDAYRPAGKPISRCGKFGEFSIGVTDYEKTAAFWQQFGFVPTHQSQEPYPWGIFSDELIVLGIHEAANGGPEYAFTGPAITYFATDMPARIAALAADGLTYVKEGILHGPDGETLFLFQGEV